MSCVKVMLAEDDEGVRETFRYLLNTVDFHVTQVCNGKEAREILRKGELFDIIISSYGGPEMNGISLLLSIRNNQLPIPVDTPFVLMSGHNDTDDRTPLVDVCAKYDAVFMPKPFSVTELTSLLEDVGAS